MYDVKLRSLELAIGAASASKKNARQLVNDAKQFEAYLTDGVKDSGTQFTVEGRVVARMRFDTATNSYCVEFVESLHLAPQYYADAKKAVEDTNARIARMTATPEMRAFLKGDG